MRTIWFLLLAILSLHVSLAAENEDSLRIERDMVSLRKSLKYGSLKNDSLKMDAYLQLSDLAKEKRVYTEAIAYLDTILLKFPKYDYEFVIDVKRKRARLFETAGKKDLMIAELLKILREVLKRGETEIAINIHSEIGIVFLHMEEFKDAEYHLKESIRIARETGNDKMVASGLMSLGNRFKNEGLFNEAEKAYKESIEICKSKGFKKELAGNYNNYGSLMRKKGNLDEALRLYNMAVEINIEIKNDLWLSFNYNNIGNVYDGKGDLQKALRYFHQSNDIKQRLGEAPGQMQTHMNLAFTYEKLGNFAEAFKHHKRYAEMKDSLDKLDRLEQSKELAAQFQAERREAEIKQLSMQDKLNKQELTASAERLDYQNFLSWTFGVGGFIILFVAFFLWRSVRARKQINEELEAKNLQIDRKNREIIDSINYAKRIQNSILPGEKRRTELLGWHGLLYRPKDIVSGDFYICDETPDQIFFGTVDCTGHGVPGAMVSIVASSSFNKALHELQIHAPHLILEQLSQDVPKVLDSNKEGINDGMDMALVALDKKRTNMQFAGAFQNCWVFNRKSDDLRAFDQRDVRVFENDEYVLFELKGIRRGIGMSDNKEFFRSIHFEVRKGDKILLSTDGFQDQFGGHENKKFKIRQLREIILRNADQRPERIIEELNNSLKRWQGTEEQIDDICVFVVEV